MNLWDKNLNLKWNLITVYGATHDEGRDGFLAELALFCGKSKEPFLVGEKNKTGGVSRFSRAFNSIISAYELMEIEMTGGKFTWSNNQPNPTLGKLDRYLMSKQWEDIFPSVKINKLPREVSDHNPLILMTDTQIPLRHLGFRFELIWIKNPIFNKIVKEI
jgi:hypothetical protein